MCEETVAKKRVFSAIQPSGMLTLGNYLGALKNWKSMTEDFECIYSVADLLPFLRNILLPAQPCSGRVKTLPYNYFLIASQYCLAACSSLLGPYS